MDINDLKPLIAKEIRRRRQNLGLTQREIAEKLGTTRVYATKMESDNPPTNLEGLLSVCDIFGCTLIDFFASVYATAEIIGVIKPKEVERAIKKSLRSQRISAEVNLTIR